MRIAGKFYGKGEGLTDDPGKPWKVWDPTVVSTDPMSALTGVQLKIQATQALTHELLAGAEYATKFSSETGEAVDGVPTTKYTITIDAPKAAAAKALGEYLTTEVVTVQKIKDVTATVLVDKDSLPHKLDFTFGTSKVSAQFSKFGAPVTITAPAVAQIDV